MPADVIEATDDGVTDPQHPRIWHKVRGTPFDTISVQAINVPNWDNTQIYVGTQKGLYSSKDSGETWREVAPNIYNERSIVSIVSIVDPNGDRTIYVASTAIIGATPLERTVSKSKMTTVHWYLEGSSLRGIRFLP